MLRCQSTHALCALVVSSAIGLTFAASQARAVDVTLTTVVSPQVAVGDEVTVSVQAQISTSDTTDGILSFDLTSHVGDSTGLHIDTSSFHSDISGATVANTTLSGLTDVSGVIATPGAGVGSPIILYTYKVVGIHTGLNSADAELSTTINGFAFSTFNEDPAILTYTTTNAVAPITVIESGPPPQVPEPTTATLLITATGTFLLARRTRR